MSVIHEIPVHSVCEFIDEIMSLSAGNIWVFRGQPVNLSLQSSFERACEGFGIGLQERTKKESDLISDFRRQYDGPDRALVNSDTLYCLALMQHHGAPTRLIDFTYSPYVALYFALRNKWVSLENKNLPVVWCINADWISDQARLLCGNTVSKRNRDNRDDTSFKKMYMNNLKKLVFLENAFSLNQRLVIQQGVFLCPGKINSTFMENIPKPKSKSKQYIFQLLLRLSLKEYKKAFTELHRMNISEASLFPGMDGFARSLKNKLIIP